MADETTTASTETTDNTGANAGNAGVSGDDRASLIAAVEAAQAGGETKTEKDITDGKVEPEKPKTPPEEEPAGSKLHAELRAREKAKGILAKAQEREATSQQAYAEAQRVLDQARAAAGEVAKEVERLRRLKDDPVAVINEFGWDPNAIIEAGARHKDPEWQAKTAAERAMNDRFGQLETQLREALEKTKKLEAIAQGYETQGATQARQAAEKQMIGLIPKDSPAHQLVAAGIWSEKTLLDMAYDADRQVRTKAKRAPSLSELAEYIHYEASEKIRRLKPQESAGRSNAGKSKANWSRALSNRDASERRGAPAEKAFDELTPEEQRAHLIATVKEARKIG